MDALLRAFAEDESRTNEFKRQFLVKSFANLSSSPLATPQCLSLFRLLLDWILVSENPMLVQLGHDQFRILAERHVSVFYDLINPNLLIDVFTNTVHTVKLEVVRCVSLLMDLLLRDLGSTYEHEELRRSVVNVTKSHLYTYLREHGVNMAVAVEISRIYRSHPALLPNEPEWNRFAVLVVSLLSGYRREEDAFAESAEEVSRILPLVWGRSEATEGIEDCLKAFYVIISTEESYSKPSCALARIMDKVTPPFLLKATNAILEESGQHEGEAKTVVALQTMIEWLTLERTNTVTSEWILNMLLKLRERDRNSILIEIAHASTEKLLMSLPNSDLSPFVEQIFFFLLLGFQHSESVFHSVVTHLPKILLELHRKKEYKLLNRLAEASHFLMLRFPDFPELYNPVADVLQQKLAISPPDDARIADLKTLSWLSPLVLSASHLHMRSPRKKGGLVEDALESRSETGMVGLINLGNTCYMNSVLQALYITKNFCNSVLSSPLSPSQVVLHKLQQAFTFLRYSQRSIYSPHEFLKAARPPWFESGRQQDCSEFLRYLLDTLHEQEKSGRGKGAITYREHMIIKASTPNGENGSSEEEPTKMKRASNSALDVISEAPEIRREEEEEMMSQGSGEVRNDEDYFGSRGSLLAERSGGGNGSGGGVGLEEEGASEDDDIGGSTTSLGSGLKRWTTEGNLSSYDGSREGKMDLLDGPPIHDSHSNSTDSGIQSVGDSIRGSSDSMTANSNPQQLLQQQQQSQPMDISDATPVVVATADVAEEEKPFVSLVQSVFGGKMQTSYQCTNCQSVSLHKECFTDLHLAIPDPFAAAAAAAAALVAASTSPSSSSSSGGPVAKKEEQQQTRQSARQAAKKAEEAAAAAAPTAPLTMQTLLTNYLLPEKLEEDNKYHCDKCEGLQDAVKSVAILEGPRHLMCTLMRFKYEQGRKSKVFTDVDYELSIELPRHDGDKDKYSLYAVVVHSGYSSDGGHYYTYAREPKQQEEEDEEEEDTWYTCNDSKVSYSTFESFKSVSKQFPRDTAYLLFYCKQQQQQPEQREVRRPLRKDLKAAVEKDNLLFLRNKERSNNNNNNSNNNLSSNQKWNRRSDDDNDRSGCGGGGFNAPGRLVC